MGIDGQQPAPEVARGAADLAEGDLEFEALGDRAAPSRSWTDISLARNGRPLASSKTRWFQVRRCRNPVRPSAAS